MAIYMWRNYEMYEYLLVAGGGAGGRSRYFGGGGGGAGGVVYCSGEEVKPGSYCIVIGAGGTSCISNPAACLGNGGNSCFDNVVAYGGGGGAGSICSNCVCGCPGANGGSGGGSSGCNPNFGEGYKPQGNDGARGAVTCRIPGGGGGYLCPGCSGASYIGGNGGEGLCSDISGEYVRYASGGGGGGCNGYSCSCGGGCGGCRCTEGCSATTYGSGGGGGGCTDSNSCCKRGGAGCQGVFILRYPSECNYNISGGCKYECNGYCIHCFTSDGTLTIN